jgi:xylulokinase
MRLNLEILEAAGCVINKLRTIGGGARSPPWNQLKADVLGRPMTRLGVSEAGCAGAAMLACAADTGHTLASLAAGWIKTREEYQPIPLNASRYDREFERYKKMRAAIMGIRAG